MNDYERIQERMNGRQSARDCWSLVNTTELSKEYCEGFADEIRKLTGVEGKEHSINAADFGPIARLGATEMPFGAHAGKTFDDVPLDYLDWLCGAQEDFYKSLRAYLRHPDLESRRRGIDL